MDATVCPECGHLAEVQWRGALESTDGAVEHSKVMCVNRHWFLLPTARLERPAPTATPQRERELPSPGLTGAGNLGSSGAGRPLAG